jgi:sigma-B regulation protein RsbU (phosphoserine phosphatase)
MTSDDLVVDVSEDWMTACDIQRHFMQRLDGPIGGFDYGAHCRQLRALGGDCYDFTMLEENRLALTIGDASGKGLVAALMISAVQSALRTAALFAGCDVATVLRAVNRQVHTFSSENQYATLFYGVLDSGSRKLRYVNAGHNPPMVMRRNGSTAWLQAGGAPVGMFPYWKYEEATFQLTEGDVVLGYTDGIVEALSPSGEEWGVEGLRRAVVENCEKGADEIVSAVFTSMDEFSQGYQTDDATALALRIN